MDAVSQQNKRAWLRTRAELLVPVPGLLIFRAMLTWQNVRLTGWQTLLISPLSSMAAHNLQAPATAVVESFGAGLAMGLIYRYRGL